VALVTLDRVVVISLFVLLLALLTIDDERLEVELLLLVANLAFCSRREDFLIGVLLLTLLLLRLAGVKFSSAAIALGGSMAEAEDAVAVLLEDRGVDMTLGRLVAFLFLPPPLITTPFIGVSRDSDAEDALLALVRVSSDPNSKSFK